ncbi:OB-fold domain-containing protein [Aneurinibacillus tyrosinisolvens]|uniref:OB-fold domain-containing protein n=1 Tax=Aneurinibacillus tyrosinisolvens TaxID=1443435 RepID=UPI000A8B47E8|nr:OB-fold domain-containing protein [Aneurinibacillus tyrosinisolvens]
MFGDGAAAFLLGSGEDVIARIVDSVTIQEEAVGQWRSQGDPFLQNWEERFVSDVFLQSVQEAAVRLAARNELTPESIAKIVVSGPGSKAYIQAVRKLGCKEEQIQDPLLLSAGAAGTAHGPMMLTAALEEAKPHDKILLLTFGEGADAILLEATEAIAEYPKRKGIKGHISIKNNELSYSDYVKWKGMLQVEPPRRPTTNRPSAPAMYRNYHQNLGFYGSRCTECGTPQFPKQRVCVHCQAKDKMEDYRFIGKKASVATYTVDYLAATPAPPALVAVIDFEGGGRIMCEVTDCSPEEVEIGMEVEMTFRRLYEAGGIHNYFWKARPKR